MSLASDLLEQANTLRDLDPRRPRQANLRRAVSSAYYAVFHALIAAAVECMIPARSELRTAVSRRFTHRGIKEAAARVASTLNKQPNPTPLDANVLLLTSALVDLQQARHQADYDLDETFTKVQVGKWIGDAGRALQALEVVRASDMAERLFWEMLLGKLDN